MPKRASRSWREASDQPVALSSAEFRRISRRRLLHLAPLALSAALLAPRLREEIVHEGLAFSDWASSKLFRAQRLAPTYADSEAVPLEKFPYNSYDLVDPGIDLERWTLRVEGLVNRPGDYTLAQIQTLRKITHNTRHVCIEGWDAIGNFSGCRISEFLLLVGANLGAGFLEFECADDYYESIDMASALHPQSLLCYEMYGRPLDRGHGAPLRLQLPTKLGYKQAKYLTVLRIRTRCPRRRVTGKTRGTAGSAAFRAGSWMEISVEKTSDRPGVRMDGAQNGTIVRAVYQHPGIVRFCHWLTAINLLVMTASGLENFPGIPEFWQKNSAAEFHRGAPEHHLGRLAWRRAAMALHLQWFFMGAGAIYVGYQLWSGRYRQVLFTHRDVPGLWPMIRHYFLFGPRPPQDGTYNPLQKLAYTTAIGLGAVSVLSGLALYKPVQFHWPVLLFGGFRLARLWHFAAMCGFLAFVPGHLLMVALHGWNNCSSMLTGWKRHAATRVKSLAVGRLPAKSELNN